MQHNIGVDARLLDRVGIHEVGMGGCGRLHRLRVVDRHDSARLAGGLGGVQSRRVSDVVAVRFEGRTQDSHPLAGERAATLLRGQVDHAGVAGR